MGSTKEYELIIGDANTHGYKIGFGLTNDIALDFLDQHVKHIDFVQLMGIAKIGKQGQPFDERTLERAKKLSTKYPDLEIAVDGSVNKETIPKLLDHGVTRFAPGSAIASQSDPVSAYKDLLALLPS